MDFIVKNEEDTIRLAGRIAALLTPGDAVFLSGPLGAGKSFFARALIRALTGITDLDVPSPTFTLVQLYDTPVGALFHFDLYRIEKENEVEELGWEDALYDGISLIEWPERLTHLAPPRRLEVNLKPVHGNNNARLITLTPRGENWVQRLRRLGGHLGH